MSILQPIDRRLALMRIENLPLPEQGERMVTAIKLAPENAKVLIVGRSEAGPLLRGLRARLETTPDVDRRVPGLRDLVGQLTRLSPELVLEELAFKTEREIFRLSLTVDEPAVVVGAFALLRRRNPATPSAEDFLIVGGDLPVVLEALLETLSVTFSEVGDGNYRAELVGSTELRLSLLPEDKDERFLLSCSATASPSKSGTQKSFFPFEDLPTVLATGLAAHGLTVERRGHPLPVPRRTEIAIPTACERCGTEATVIHRVRCKANDVRYSESFSCAQCGHAWESDDDRIPPTTEQQLVDRDGRWAVFVDRETKGRASTVAVFMRVLGLGRREALALAKRLPADAPAMRGLRERVEAVADALIANGVDCRVVREA